MSRESFIKMRGAWDIRHWIDIPNLDCEVHAKKIERLLSDVPGVRKIMTYPNRQQIRISYDQTKTDFKKILKTLADAGFPATNGWWAKKKASWFYYLDQNARVNAAIPASPCCSNPTQILNQQKKRR